MKYSIAVCLILCTLSCIECKTISRSGSEPFKSRKALSETIHNYTIVQPVITNKVESKDGSHPIQFTLTVNDFSVHLTMNEKLFPPHFTSKHYDENEEPVISTGYVNCFYQGWVEGHPEWKATMSTCAGLKGSFGDSSTVDWFFHIEPLDPTMNTQFTGPHVLYLESEFEPREISCGTPHSNQSSLEDGSVHLPSVDEANLRVSLIYNGRVLRYANQLSYYKIEKGCTIFYTRKVPKLGAPASYEPGIVSPSFTTLTTNAKMLSVIGRILSNPSLLRAMIAGTPLEQNPTIISALANPELLANMSDPGSVCDFLNDNPHMATLMENMLHVYENLRGGVERVDGELLEPQDTEEGREEWLRTAQQDEMFEHSQAIHAHQQQAQVNTPHQAHPPSRPQHATEQRTHQSTRQQATQNYTAQHRTTQRQNSGGAITQDQLASALAGAMSNSASPLSSLNMSHSGPSSLSTQSITQSVQESNGSGQSELAGSISRQSSVTTDSLQEALVSVMNNASSSTGTQHSTEQRMVPQEKYKAQLEQLHFMGILDDVLSIQALDATGGDIQAALEIIYNS